MKKKTSDCNCKWEDSDLLKVTNAITTQKMVTAIDKAVRVIPDYPREGVMFRDITALWNDADAFRCSVSALQLFLYEHMAEIDKIVAIEARGWVYGAALADRLNRPFVPIRKHGKLPSEKLTEHYKLEYGVDSVEIHADAIKQGERVILIDDLIATGGSTAAAISLIDQLGGDLKMVLALIDLKGLHGKDLLRSAGKENGYEVYSVVTYPGK